eukprot:GEMP01010651.1.p1 GENE.GEMP01010651.1~~GEMP01010651.1.p1  ORF type:complete len:928 (+),score=153.55 GEMP01010651.1:15-2798(+)
MDTDQRADHTKEPTADEKRLCADLPEHFYFIRSLGKGSYGLVGSFQIGPEGRCVALKKVTNVFQNTLVTRRTLREVKLLRHFSHENVLRLLDVLPLHNDRDLSLVTELMDYDLDSLMRDRKNKNQGPWNLDRVQSLSYQLLNGCRWLHRANVIHRDLKPGNIFILRSQYLLKIGDLGLARGLDDPRDGLESTTMTAYVVTRWYRSPEVMLTLGGYDTKVDMWSVGCIIYEMMTLTPLFPGRNVPVDQLRLIFAVIELSAEERSKIAKRTDGTDILRKNHHCPQSIETLIRRSRFFVSEKVTDYVDLLTRLLTFNAARRWSADDAMAHEVFRNKMPLDVGVAPGIMEFSYDKKFGSSKDDNPNCAETRQVAKELKIELLKEVNERRAQYQLIPYVDEPPPISYPAARTAPNLHTSPNLRAGASSTTKNTVRCTNHRHSVSVSIILDRLKAKTKNYVPVLSSRTHTENGRLVRHSICATAKPFDSSDGDASGPETADPDVKRAVPAPEPPSAFTVQESERGWTSSNNDHHHNITHHRNSSARDMDNTVPIRCSSMDNAIPALNFAMDNTIHVRHSAMDDTIHVHHSAVDNSIPVPHLAMYNSSAVRHFVTCAQANHALLPTRKLTTDVAAQENKNMNVQQPQPQQSNQKQEPRRAVPPTSLAKTSPLAGRIVQYGSWNSFVDLERGRGMDSAQCLPDTQPLVPSSGGVVQSNYLLNSHGPALAPLAVYRHNDAQVRRASDGRKNRFADNIKTNEHVYGGNGRPRWGATSFSPSSFVATVLRPGNTYTKFPEFTCNQNAPVPHGNTGETVQHRDVNWHQTELDPERRPRRIVDPHKDWALRLRDDAHHRIDQCHQYRPTTITTTEEPACHRNLGSRAGATRNRTVAATANVRADALNDTHAGRVYDAYTSQRWPRTMSETRISKSHFRGR